MNNNESLSYQNAGNNNQPQSLIKLPIIFTLMMLGCYLSNNLINQYIINPSNSSDTALSLYEDILIPILINAKYLIIYFCIAFIVCIVQKMHQVTAKNILVMLGVAIIYVVVANFSLLGYRQLYSSLIENSHLSYDNLQLLLTIVAFIFFILQLLILTAIFTLMGSINRNQSASYVISATNFRPLFALLFTVIFLFPSMLFSTWRLPDELVYFIYEMVSSLFLYSGNEHMLWPLVFAISSFLIFLMTLINFLIIYFIVRGCFVRQFSTIPFKLLFKSVGWAYLYLIGFNIVISIIYFVLVLGISLNMNGYRLMAGAVILIALTSIIFIVISIVGNIKLMRKAVRKYFA